MAFYVFSFQARADRRWTKKTFTVYDIFISLLLNFEHEIIIWCNWFYLFKFMEKNMMMQRVTISPIHRYIHAPPSIENLLYTEHSYCYMKYLPAPPLAPPTSPFESKSIDLHVFKKNYRQIPKISLWINAAYCIETLHRTKKVDGNNSYVCLKWKEFNSMIWMDYCLPLNRGELCSKQHIGLVCAKNVIYDLCWKSISVFISHQ